MIRWISLYIQSWLNKTIISVDYNEWSWFGYRGILLSSVIYAPGCPTAIMYRRETTSSTGGRCAAARSAGEIRSTTGLTMNLRKAPQTASELKSAQLCILGRIIKEQQTLNTARVHQRSLWIISNKHHQRRKRPPREPEAYWGWQENGFTFLEPHVISVLSD